MRRNLLRSGALLLILALVLSSARIDGQQRVGDTGTGDKKQAAKINAAVLSKLIQQLGSSNYRMRENASRQLTLLENVPDALRRAAKSDDPEIARRAQVAITIITTRNEEKAFQILVRQLHKIELDHLVRRMVAEEKFAQAQQWQYIQGVARAVTKEANRLAARRFAATDFDVKTMRRLLWKSESKNPRSVDGAALLCAGPMPYMKSVSNSLVIVDGDFRGGNTITNSLLIVRGNVGHIEKLLNSIILATGSWEDGTVCRGNFVQVRNHKMRFANLSDSLLLETIVEAKNNTNTQILNGVKGPLQLLRFGSRKADDQLVWGKEVNDLAVAIAPAGREGEILIRWKNTGKASLALPWARLHSHRIDKYRDDLLGHVFLKDSNGKLAPARKYPAPWTGRPSYLRRAFILGPGDTFEETIDLENYVEKPAAGGCYRLSIELDISSGREAWDREVKTWSGKIQSNVVDVMIGR